MTQALTGKKILLGVCGGVAAYKAAVLVRQLKQAGAEVEVVMTEAARHFVGELTFQALSGRPVLSSLWQADAASADAMPHIRAVRQADAMLIAPLSAHTLAKLALGLADNLLTNLALARDIPLWVAPAMNQQMWQHPTVARHVAQVRADGVQVIGPASGEQACGELGLGRMSEPEQIVTALRRGLSTPHLAGRRVLITAGPTFEALDQVRGLSNLSSGQMGYALAEACLEAGAEVVLVSGPVALAAPEGAQLVSVTSASQMYQAVHQHLATPKDIFIGVAAVADYTVAQPQLGKRKKNDQPWLLELMPTQDILASVASCPQRPPLVVGFAAEAERLEHYAQDKLKRKKLDLIVANQLDQALGLSTAALQVFGPQGEVAQLPAAPKPYQAAQLVKLIAQARSSK